MAYATAPKIRLRLPALPASGADSDVDAQIADAILDADSIVNAYLAKGGYTVPVTGGEEALKLLANVSSTLAAAYCVRDSFSGGGETKSPSLYDTLHGEAMKILEMLAEKDILLPVEETPDVDELPDAGAVYGAHTNLDQRSNIRDAPFWREYPESYYNTGTTGYR